MTSHSDDGTEKADESRAPAAKVVPHFTREERAARGRAARAEVPRSMHAQIEFPPERDPVALLEEQAVSRVQELVPDPVRADARVAVCVLPRRRVDHGGGPLADPDLGPKGAAVRRCAPVELRSVRLAGAKSGLRHERFRRVGAGPLGVGCEAARGELRHRRDGNAASRRRSGGRSPSRRCAPTGKRCARLRACGIWRCGTRTSRWSRRSASSPRASIPSG